MPFMDTGVYIAEAIESIRSQTVPAFEVVCVDDGSRDNSRAIVEDFVARDPRIRLLDAPRASRGPGAARNHALRMAAADHVAFLDSDDLLRPDFTESLMARSREFDADVVMCCIEQFGADATSYVSKQCSYDKYIPSGLDGQVFDVAELGDDALNLRFVAWNKLYRRQWLLDSGLEFAEDAFYEDLSFTFGVLLAAQRIVFVRQPLVMNRKLRSGATTFGRSDRTLDLVGALDHLDALQGEGAPWSEEAIAALRFRKLCSHLPKVEPQELEPYYDQVREAAARVVDLDAHSQLSKNFRAHLDAVVGQNLVGYLSWALWRAEHRLDRAQAARRAALASLEDAGRPEPAVTGSDGPRAASILSRLLRRVRRQVVRVWRRARRS